MSTHRPHLAVSSTFQTKHCPKEYGNRSLFKIIILSESSNMYASSLKMHFSFKKRCRVKENNLCTYRMMIMLTEPWLMKS